MSFSLFFTRNSYCRLNLNLYRFPLFSFSFVISITRTLRRREISLPTLIDPLHACEFSIQNIVFDLGVLFSYCFNLPSTPFSLFFYSIVAKILKILDFFRFSLWVLSINAICFFFLITLPFVS